MSSLIAAPGSSLRVWTYKNASTVLARFAHDLCFETQQFSLSTRESEGEHEVTVRVDPLELHLLGSVGQGGALSEMKPRDKVEIERTMRTTVLNARRHPEIVFTAAGSGDSLRGALKLHGSAQTLLVSTTREGMHCTGEVEFPPSRWGIKPYRAFLGALKLDDRVKISWDITLTEA